MATIATDLDPSRPDLLGHPRGLVTLAGTELWERISFHGMLALLTLYMAEQLLLPGHVEHIVGFPAYRMAVESITRPLTVEALAAQTFGLYVGLIYFTPVFGGLVGDRLIGRRNAVILGASLMALGHLCMAFEQSFLVALLLLILGAGFLRGNLISQVNALYAGNDVRSRSGIQIYYGMVNAGGFVAPLITGLLGQRYGWHSAFGFAGFGMLAGLVIYLVGLPNLPADPVVRGAAPPTRLSPAERRTVATLVALLPILTMFWIAQSQYWNVYNLWARDHVDLVVLGWQMPVAWVQALSGLSAVLPVPLVLGFWRWLRARGLEPDDAGKMALGCLLFACFVVWDASGTLLFGLHRDIPLLWIVVSNFGLSFGYLHVQPVAIALFARVAPRSVNAMMVGVYFLSIFAGSILSGRIGALYERWTPTQFWLLHAAIVGGAGLIFVAFAPLIRRGLAETPPHALTAEEVPQTGLGL